MKKKSTEKAEQPTNSEILKKSRRRANRLNSIKYEMESGRVKDFDQIFAIISQSRLANELHISFYSFLKKVKDPMQWTVGEMIRFATLLGTEYSTVHEFVLARLKEKTKGNVFRDQKSQKALHFK